MDHSAGSFKKIKDFAERYGFLLLSFALLILSFKILPDYGLGFDSPKNFTEGMINLDYLLTGDALPRHQMVLTFQIHGSFFFMAADLAKRILNESLGWLEPVAARHAILPVLIFGFLNILYAFLRKYSSTRTALLTCGILTTVPPFFGHFFHNIKDIPLVIFFSLTIFFFYEWYASDFKKTRFLYGTFLCLGFSLLSKLYAVLIPVILLPWLILLRLSPPPGPGLSWKPQDLLTRKNALHALAGAVLVLALLALFFMPAFYSISDKRIFLEMKNRTIEGLMKHGSQGWSFYPWIQVFYVTPLLTLVLAVIGLARTLIQKHPSALEILMEVWFFGVMMTACTPLFPVYNGIRLFMVFLIPFCFFTSNGISWIAGLAEKAFSFKKSWGMGILGMVLILLQIGGIRETHPYETAFFNRFAGGLGGAQKKNLPDAGDYWLTSYREGVRWINRNAPLRAILWLPSLDSLYLTRYYPLRTDLSAGYIKETPLPSNSFLILPPGETPWLNVPEELRKKIQGEIPNMKKVHEVRRQNGEIFSIYYKP